MSEEIQCRNCGRNYYPDPEKVIYIGDETKSNCPFCSHVNSNVVKDWEGTHRDEEGIIDEEIYEQRTEECQENLRRLTKKKPT